MFYRVWTAVTGQPDRKDHGLECARLISEGMDVGIGSRLDPSRCNGASQPCGSPNFPKELQVAQDW